MAAAQREKATDVKEDSGGTWEAGLLQSGLTCPICMEFLSEPLLLDCGHAFCRLCLLQSSRLAPDGRHCPSCRRPIDIKDPVAHPADQSLVDRVAFAVPAAEITTRKTEDAKKLKEFLEQQNNSLPVFYMRGVASRVGEDVFLHLFEPRYRILIRRAWEGNKRFICAQRQPASGDRGLLVEVFSAKFRADGKADIQGRGVDIVEMKQVKVEEGTGGLYYADIGELPARSSSAGSRTDSLERSRGSSRGASHRISSGQSPELQVREVLRLAIQEGAPRYNRGDRAGCAAIYFAAAEKCLERLEEPVGSSGEQIATLLRQSIRDGREVGDDANRAAWTLRHAFDEVLALPSSVEPPSRRSSRGSSREAFRREFPVFYLRPGVSVGAAVRLNLFEPRYRRLARTVWDAPERLFLYSSAAPSTGARATVVRLETCDWDAQGCALIRGVGVESTIIGDIRTEADGLYYATSDLPVSTTERAATSNREDSANAKCGCILQ